MTASLDCVGPGGRVLRFCNPPGVYSVNRYQSLWLASTAYYETLEYLAETGARLGDLRVWEPCCGSGPAAIFLKAARAGHVRATDVNPRALEACRVNAAANGQVLDEVAAADMLDLPAGRAFDVIVCNPPCRPTEYLPRGLEPDSRLAIDGGPEGVDYLLNLIHEARRWLTSTGRLMFILVSTAHFLKIQEALRAVFPEAWRVSLNSPVAQPLVEDGLASERIIQAAAEGRVIAWRHGDGQLWRLSWVVVATNGPGWAAGPGRLYYRNHSFDINDPGYLRAVEHFESFP